MTQLRPLHSAHLLHVHATEAVQALDDLHGIGVDLQQEVEGQVQLPQLLGLAQGLRNPAGVLSR